MNSKSCTTCAHSVPGDYGGRICVHPDLLDSGIVLTVGDNEVCCDIFVEQPDGTFLCGECEEVREIKVEEMGDKNGGIGR